MSKQTESNGWQDSTEKPSKRQYLYETSDKPVIKKYMTQEEINEFVLILAKMHKVDVSMIFYTCAVINDEHDEDRHDYMWLLYWMKPLTATINGNKIDVVSNVQQNVPAIEDNNPDHNNGNRATENNKFLNSKPAIIFRLKIAIPDDVKARAEKIKAMAAVKETTHTAETTAAPAAAKIETPMPEPESKKMSNSVKPDMPKPIRPARPGKHPH